ncbi:MAG: hypothetical protein K2Z81_03040 [Cyanobacteria bacterium]|nr:hypothetical protein [Cyanobacteriota bacterium]
MPYKDKLAIALLSTCLVAGCGQNSETDASLLKGIKELEESRRQALEALHVGGKSDEVLIDIRSAESYEAAVDLLNQAIARREKKFGKNDPSLCLIFDALISTLRKIPGRGSDMRQAMFRIYEIRNACLGGTAPDVVASLSSASLQNTNAEQTRDSLTAIERHFKQAKTLSPAGEALLVATKAQLYFDSGNSDLALASANAAMKILSEITDQSYYSRQLSVLAWQRLGEAWTELKKSDRAVLAFQHAFEICKKEESVRMSKAERGLVVIELLGALYDDGQYKAVSELSRAPVAVKLVDATVWQPYKEIILCLVVSSSSQQFQQDVVRVSVCLSRCPHIDLNNCLLSRHLPILVEKVVASKDRKSARVLSRALNDIAKNEEVGTEERCRFVEMSKRLGSICR